MKGTRTWKWAVVALSIAALMSVGCAKKQTVKTERRPGSFGRCPLRVTEAPVKRSRLPWRSPPATPPRSRAYRGEVSQFDDVRFDFDKSELKEDGRKSARPWPAFLKKNPGGEASDRGIATSAAPRSTTWRWGNVGRRPS